MSTLSKGRLTPAKIDPAPDWTVGDMNRWKYALFLAVIDYFRTLSFSSLVLIPLLVLALVGLSRDPLRPDNWKTESSHLRDKLGQFHGNK
jgi:hypothetical protein